MKTKDILVTPLRRIDTEGGDVMHGLKNKDIGYKGFGEAYFSWVSNDAVKAWKCHLEMTMNLIVPVGQVKFVFQLENIDGINEFRTEEIGVNRYMRITVPPGIWFGFQGISSQSLILNIASIPHDPNEVKRLEINKINYIWS